MNSTDPIRFVRRWVWIVFIVSQAAPKAFADVTYTNFTRPGPIQIHLLKIPRHNPALEIKTIHSGARPITRSPLTEQLKLIKGGNPVAAINGDFFQLDGSFAGDPRGLQIVNGTMISAPANSATFWIDAAGAPHINITRSSLRLTWPDGSTAPLNLNGQCDTNEFELYTPDLKSLPRANAVREIALLSNDQSLEPSKEYSMRVSDDASNSFLLALGAKAPPLPSGSVIKISTTITPALRGVSDAISGGPILISAGKRHAFGKPVSNAFSHRHTIEKHPRTALGWNKNEYIWLIIDGRRNDSVGMTLNELGEFMLELGCTEAMNLDGGGSSTLWFDGKVRNRPSDGAERPIANALVLIRK